MAHHLTPEEALRLSYRQVADDRLVELDIEIEELRAEQDEAIHRLAQAAQAVREANLV